MGTDDVAGGLLLFLVLTLKCTLMPHSGLCQPACFVELRWGSRMSLPRKCQALFSVLCTSCLATCLATLRIEPCTLDPPVHPLLRPPLHTENNVRRTPSLALPFFPDEEEDEEYMTRLEAFQEMMPNRTPEEALAAGKLRGAGHSFKTPKTRPAMLTNTYTCSLVTVAETVKPLPFARVP